MTFLEKLQKLPVLTKKIILWAIVIIIGIIFLAVWVRNSQARLRNFQLEGFKEQLKLPSLEGSQLGLPKIKAPNINEEELKKIEEELKKVKE